MFLGGVYFSIGHCRLAESAGHVLSISAPAPKVLSLMVLRTLTTQVWCVEWEDYFQSHLHFLGTTVSDRAIVCGGVTLGQTGCP